VRPALALALAGIASASPAGGPDFRLVRASADGAGGGHAQAATYSLVVAFGQHDAGASGFGGSYGFAGGVFASLPVDRVFVDGFE
jgi:hypothetical protein